MKDRIAEHQINKGLSREIDLSLRRMETGEYGICGVCGEEIPLARLNAIPWTRRCVTCAGGGISRDRGGLSRLDPGFSYR